MKTLLLLGVIAATKGSSLWSVPIFKNSLLDFTVSYNRGSVAVSAFVKDSDALLQNPSKNIKFFLFTRKQHQGIQLEIGAKSTLIRGGFDFNYPTKILIHGFANSLSSSFNEILKRGYLTQHPLAVNVLVVDWSSLSIPPFYVAAVHNAEQVGEYVAQVLAWFAAEGASLRRFHVLGYSVGAHIAGVAALHLQRLGLRRLGRITGLDPAKPMFELQDADYRLTADDADFVDCIHTCGGYLGLSEPTCSVDFYPNGGTNPQPGCTFDFLGRCSHQRAYIYFAESIAYPEAFRAVLCSGVESYSPVNCSQQSIVTMGEYTSTESLGIYYLSTVAKAPFHLSISTQKLNTLTKFLWYFY